VTVDLLRLANVAAAECVRQHVGLDGLRNLLLAYDQVLDMRRQGDPIVTEYGVLSLAGTVQPSNGGRYRVTPATFINGGTAVAAERVPNLIAALVVHGGSLAPVEWVKEFLDIHPFTDGNGRTAWLLLNVLGGTLDAPVPLPDLYDER